MGRSFSRWRYRLTCFAAAAIAAVAATLPGTAVSAGSYWSEPVTFESCHGGGAGGGAPSPFNDVRVSGHLRQGWYAQAWCRFKTSRGGVPQAAGGGYGWGTRTDLFQGTYFRSRYTRHAQENYSYTPYGGDGLFTFTAGDFARSGEETNVGSEFDATVLTGGPNSGASGQQTDAYSTWWHNYQNPHFWISTHFLSGDFDRYFRNSNSRFWIHDMQGPTIGPLGRQRGAFSCIDGSGGDNGWYQVGANAWCNGRARFHWASHDNGELTGFGRGGSGLIVDGTAQVATWGDLPNSDTAGEHYWDGGWGYPGTGAHYFEAHRAPGQHGSLHQGANHPWAFTGPQWVNLDQTNPTPPTHLTANIPQNQWSNAASLTVTAQGGTDVGSGVKHYRWYHGVNSDIHRGLSYTVSGEGSYGFTAMTYDNVDRNSDWGASGVYLLDRTPPPPPSSTLSTGFAAGRTGVWTNQDVTATRAVVADPQRAGVNAVSGVAGYRIQTCRHATVNVGPGACSEWTPHVAANTQTATDEGFTYVRVQAYDNASNNSTNDDSQTSVIRIDKTPPTKPAFQ